MSVQEDILEPVVKALEWKGTGDECYSEQGPFRYTIRPPNRTKGWRVWVEINDKAAAIGGTIVTMTAKDMNDAMSIAQADYEKRIRSAIEPSARFEPTHRHAKRGTDYVLIGIGKMQAEEWYEATTVIRADLDNAEFGKLNKVDMHEVAIYRSVTDPSEIWVRPREEFEDGRFIALTAALEGK